MTGFMVSALLLYLIFKTYELSQFIDLNCLHSFVNFNNYFDAYTFLSMLIYSLDHYSSENVKENVKNGNYINLYLMQYQ